MVVLLLGWLTFNWIYQAMRKPSELFSPVSGAFVKPPSKTWREYSTLFREHATPVITAELLASLAQIEGAGNPLAQTYWRWNPGLNPFKMYHPASSAVGMFQMTDPAFQEAKRYCIRNHVVVEEGPWHEMNSCWFNSLYTRVLPSHAVELTAAMLDRAVANALRRHRGRTVTLQQKQDLAALIHLCGAGTGDAYTRRGFRLSPQQRCGEHDVRNYLMQVNAMKRQFAKLAAAG